MFAVNPFTFRLGLAVACAAVLTAHAARAETGANRLGLIVTGDENRLSIIQDHVGPGPANHIALEITGHANGGFGAPWPEALPGMTGLLQGSLWQSGTDNTITLAVLGDENLFAIAQDGTTNRVEGRIEGLANQVAILQTGWGNTANFVQSGTGNMIVVSQSGR